MLYCWVIQLGSLCKTVIVPLPAY